MMELERMSDLCLCASVFWECKCGVFCQVTYIMNAIYLSSHTC